MVNIDFSVPKWLISYYHIIGIISLCLNSFGLYLLVFQSHKLDKFRYFMFAYQATCFLTDVHLTSLMQPVPLYPIFAGFTVGIFADWFDISTHFSMMFLIFLVVVQLEFLVLCFAKKQQPISITLNVHVLPKWFEYSCYLLCIVCPFAVCIWFQTVHLAKEEQWNVIETKYPEYLSNFRALSHFDVYTKTPNFLILMIITLAGGVAISIIFVCFILDIFWMMRQLKFKISATNFQKHKEAVQSLMVQFATASLCLIPPSLLMMVIMLEMEQAQLFTEICILWFAAHSSTNMIFLSIFFPPYRNFILKKLNLKQEIIRVFRGGQSSNIIKPETRPTDRNVLSIAEIS